MQTIMSVNKLVFSRLKSFKNALRGLLYVVLNEKNIIIHMALSVVVLLMGFYFKITATEWCLLLFAIGLVLCFEILNTAVERVADLYTQQYNKLIGQVKDISAGGVLLAAIIASIIGLIIFIPKIIS